MNIAVLIGVSQYKTVPPLPGCSSDVSQMHRLLQATKKYADVYSVTTNTEAAPLKEQLRSFFSRYKTSGPIEEAFVYFSGHGLYHDDVLLCCSDFDPRRPASTSLSNTEIDDLLRSVAPEVAVKIIDACQSGSPYIKDTASSFEKGLRESKLKSFICMASSKTDQSSYATAECSVFTDRLIDAALSKSEGTILYRDINAALADAFVDNPEQTPHFVIQGTGLEVFSSITSEMQSLAAARSKTGETHGEENTIAARLAEEISRMDSLYVSAEDASRAVEQAGNNLANTPISNPLLSQFYDKRVSRETKWPTVPQGQQLAQFVKEQAWDKKYFVKIRLEEYRVKALKTLQSPLSTRLMTPLNQMLLSEVMRPHGDDEYVIETRTRPGSIEATQSLPFELAEVKFEANSHPALKPFLAYVGLIHSLTEAVILSGVAPLRVTGWADRVVESAELQWRHQVYAWKDLVAYPDLIWKDALTRAEEIIVAYLESLLPKKDDTDIPPLQDSGTKHEAQAENNLTTPAIKTPPAS